jgi:hypothetical protein
MYRSERVERWNTRVVPRRSEGAAAVVVVGRVRPCPSIGSDARPLPLNYRQPRLTIRARPVRAGDHDSSTPNPPRTPSTIGTMERAGRAPQPASSYSDLDLSVSG